MLLDSFELPISWSKIQVNDAVKSVSTIGKKIPQKEYLSSGMLQVIDQGQDFIGGYTNDFSLKVECTLPVIIFGDHTRVVKYINKDFAAGADGVKVLESKGFFNVKLLNYLIQYISSKLPSQGYARHYQHLSKEDLPLPPINEQHRIVAKIEELFSELDQGIDNLKTSQAQLKVYRQALLKHAFEGKLTAEWRAQNADKLESASALQQRIQHAREQRYQHQLAEWQVNGKQGSKPKAPEPIAPFNAEELGKLPYGWIELSVENMFDIEDGDRGEHYPTKSDFLDDGHCLFLNAKNVTKRGFAFQEMSFISEKKDFELRKGKLKRGDIIFTSRGTLGNIAHYNDSIKYDHIRINSGMFIIRNYDISLTSDFLYFHLNAPIITSQIEKLQSGTAQPQLPIREFKSFRFVIPSKEEQQQIVQELESKLSEIDQLDQTISNSLQQAEALRQSILKKAFSGELVPQDPNDEPASELLARIKNARPQSSKGKHN